jgi:hypothetical protein
MVYFTFDREATCVTPLNRRPDRNSVDPSGSATRAFLIRPDITSPISVDSGARPAFAANPDETYPSGRELSSGV